jgi:hypothetical protein
MRRVATQVRARIVLSVAAGLVLGAVGSASAESKRVGVPKFDGPQEAVVRKAVMQVLKRDGYEVVGSREIDAAARSAGGSLDSNEGFRAVAKELSLSSFVTGEVAKKKAKLTVRNGGDGTVSGEGSFAGANPAKIAAEVRDGFSRRLGSAVARGRAPSGAKKPVAAPPPAPEDESEGEEAPAPVAAKPVPRAVPEAESTSSESASGESGGSSPDVIEKKAEPAPSSAADEGAPRALDLFAGMRGFHRSLAYNQNVYGDNVLSPFTLTLGPAVAFDAVIFPAGFATAGILSYFGAAVNIEQAFGVGASRSSGETMPTIVHDYAGAGVFRVPFQGGHELLLSVGGGEHAFSIRSSDDVPRASLTTLPDTIYRYVRAGIGGRFMVAPGFFLSGAFGWRQILNKGGTSRNQIAHGGTPAEPNGYFPFLDVKAIDLNVGLGYQVTPSIELRAAFDLRRYGFAMNSSPAPYQEDPETGENIGGDFAPDGVTPINKVAGGAVDQYTSITVGVAYVFGGVSPGAEPVVEEAAEAPPPPTKKKKKAKKASEDEDEDGGDESSED